MHTVISPIGAATVDIKDANVKPSLVTGGKM